MGFVFQGVSKANLLHRHKRHVLGFGIQHAGAGCAIVLAKFKELQGVLANHLQSSCLSKHGQSPVKSMEALMVMWHQVMIAARHESVNLPTGQADKCTLCMMVCKTVASL